MHDRRWKCSAPLRAADASPGYYSTHEAILARQPPAAHTEAPYKALSMAAEGTTCVSALANARYQVLLWCASPRSSRSLWTIVFPCSTIAPPRPPSSADGVLKTSRLT